MAYTEIKQRNFNKYYYRVISVRKGNKVQKRREYLGVNLNKKILEKKEKEADLRLNSFNKLDTLEKIKPKIIKILQKNDIKKAGIFGSYARGDQRKNSDIDIIIEPTEGIGFGFARIEFELEKLLKKKVDLVSYNGLSPYLKDKILDQEVRII